MKAASIVLAVFLTFAVAVGAPAATKAAVPRELLAAEEAYKSNIALGDSLAGKTPTMEHLSDAQSFFEAAISQAQVVLATNPDLAEAHRLLGLILCTGYRIVEVAEPQGGEGGGTRTAFVLRQGGADCEQGLAEMRTAMGLAKSQFGYQVDYAEALNVCGDAKAAERQAREAWKLSLSASDRAHCARLLVQLARAANQTQEEIRWLRELVKCDPQDTAAKQRLAKLAPPAPGGAAKPANAIAWVDYETGMERAAKQKKLVLAVFTATWCPTCRKLEEEVLQHRDVIAVSRQFICVKVDVDQRTDVKSKHAVNLYPTTLVLDSDEQEWLRLISFESAGQYAGELEGALARAKVGE